MLDESHPYQFLPILAKADFNGSWQLRFQQLEELVKFSKFVSSCEIFQILGAAHFIPNFDKKSSLTFLKKYDIIYIEKEKK